MLQLYYSIMLYHVIFIFNVLSVSFCETMLYCLKTKQLVLDLVKVWNQYHVWVVKTMWSHFCH